MIVKLRNPSREIVIEGARKVHQLLKDLDINRESVLVIVDGELVTSEITIRADSVVEIRPVISGGAGG